MAKRSLDLQEKINSTLAVATNPAKFLGDLRKQSAEIGLGGLTGDPSRQQQARVNAARQLANFRVGSFNPAETIFGDDLRKGFETNLKGLFGDDPQLAGLLKSMASVATDSITKPDRTMEELTATVKNLDDTFKLKNLGALDANTKALRELKAAIEMEINPPGVKTQDGEAESRIDPNIKNKVISTQAGARTRTKLPLPEGPMFEQNLEAVQRNQSNNQFDRS